MSSIAQIQADLIRAEGMLSDMCFEFRSDLKAGCDECIVDNLECLNQLVIALRYEVTKPVVSVIAEKLYNEMLLILGNYSPIVQIKGYWGVKSTVGVLSYADIIAGTEVLFLPGTNVTIPYNFNTFLVPWFAIPATEPVKVAYQDTVVSDNFGNIGTPTDLIGAPVLVAGSIPLNFYGGNYLTIQATPLQMKNS